MFIRSLLLPTALFFVQVQAQGAAAPDSIPSVETLADGNERDPKPTAERLRALVAASKKNMIRLPGGSFEMGDWGSKVNDGALPYDSSPDSKPLHNVRLTGFLMGKYPVTYAEFDTFTAASGLPRINQEKLFLVMRKPKNPAGVSWQGAKDYCQWLGKQAGLPIDLPTEAQWEYAARSGGKRHLYPTDNGAREDGRNAPSFEQKEQAGGLVEVGSFPPNPAGFHDFGAAIREWTNDWYDAEYYSKSPMDNPKGPAEGQGRVVRGDFGNIQMTFQRWHRSPVEKTGSWTLYSEQRGGPKRQIPDTKYSGDYEGAFRCVVNQPQLKK